MRQLLKYSFSICFLLSLFFVQAQEKKTTTKIEDVKITDSKTATATKKNTQSKLDTVKTETEKPKTDRYGLIVGVDINKVARSFYDSNYKGIAFTGDYRFSKKNYIYAELGSEDITVEDPLLTTNTKGTYIKFGLNRNLYTNWLDMENLITVGVRGGFSTFNEKLNNYLIYNPHPYFGSSEIIDSGITHDGLTASWMEVSTGLNVKVFNNVYVGFALQLKVLITNSEPSDFENLYIPGFNRTYDGNFGAGFNYTVAYFIPIYKKKVVPVKTEATPKEKPNTPVKKAQRN
ncbi:DUF6048 family protein [Flavobacterium gilvum]|uniref:Outer membrane protein beta-barrel domain-containing protein n=1 Tax=Flavobacterium gilvum TaxID=1492737 RepID=A0AAC9N5I5_9FLAO|nr:DUF6048 family protein [Flavobacterium gilvum]AOW09791.1 hypothetical protein EM308_09895 [Flavobacterium gilvum]KFC60347.1 hypothetical protein FEM08_08240 [Flavobacterium gilvum]